MKTLKLSLLLSKTTLVNFKTLTMLLMFPFIGLFFPMVFIPLGEGGMPLAILIAIMIPTAILFGTSIYNFKQSSIYVNYKATTKSRTNIYLSTMILTIIVIFILMWEFIGLLFIFIKWGLINPDWPWYENSLVYHYDINYFNYPVFILTVLEISGMTFAISFAMRNVIKNNNTYYIIWISILIVSLMWGSTLNSFFISLGEGVKYTRNLLPKTMFIPSLFFPFYAPSQLSYMVVTSFQTTGGLDSNILLNVVFANEESRIAYNMMLWNPLIWLSVFAIIGIMLREKY